MRGKPAPPKEPIAVHMRTVGRLSAGRALSCGRCGQRLPKLTHLVFHTELLRQMQRDKGGLSPNGLYIDTREMAEGWWIDGETLRANKERIERRRHAREKVRTSPRAGTAVARQKLSSGKGLIPHERQQREAGAPFPHAKYLPAPRSITCDECDIENRIELTPQSDAG